MALSFIAARNVCCRRSGSSIATTARRMMGSSSVVDNEPSPLSSVYVHQVSKSVLQHLQQNHHTWLTQSGLHRGLHINANGTFTLQFPSSCVSGDRGRIWTSYDISTRQHWLSVYRRKLKTRFLLKDAAAATSGKGNLDAQKNIGLCVDQLINMIESQAAQKLIESRFLL